MRSRHISQLNRAISILKSDDRSATEIEFLSNFVMDYKELAVYLGRMSIAGINQVMRACYLEEYETGDHIFYKGDHSDKFYLILFGSVCVYNLNKENVVTFSSILNQGQKLGEQGLVTGMPRSMSAKAHCKVFMLCMFRPAFKQFLEKTVLFELESQLNYIDMYFPNIYRYGSISRIRIAYSMHTVHYRRNKVVLTKNVNYDMIYFVFEGECSIVSQANKNKEKCFVKLSKGSCFGEECGLMGKPAGHTIKVSSEYAILFFIRKIDVKRVIPEEVLEVLVGNYYLKQRSRLLLKEASKSDDPSFDETQLAPIELYPMASGIARRQIHMQFQRTQSSLGCRLLDPLHVGYKKKLRQFRSGISLKEEEGLKHTRVRSRRSDLAIKRTGTFTPAVSRMSSPTNLRLGDYEGLKLTSTVSRRSSSLTGSLATLSPAVSKRDTPTSRLADSDVKTLTKSERRM